MRRCRHIGDHIGDRHRIYRSIIDPKLEYFSCGRPIAEEFSCQASREYDTMLVPDELIPIPLEYVDAEYCCETRIRTNQFRRLYFFVPIFQRQGWIDPAARQHPRIASNFGMRRFQKRRYRWSDICGHLGRRARIVHVLVQPVNLRPLWNGPVETLFMIHGKADQETGRDAQGKPE